MKTFSVILFAILSCSTAFVSPFRTGINRLNQDVKFEMDSSPAPLTSTSLSMAQISEKEAKAGIDKVVAALRRDKAANEELGKLSQVTTVLGYGSPKKGQIAVRFNASFEKGGFGLSSVPLPFGLGQSNKSEGRGKMVGQVKAAINADTGKIVSVSVFRDLGYGRSFEMKV